MLKILWQYQIFPHSINGEIPKNRTSELCERANTFYCGLVETHTDRQEYKTNRWI